MRHLFHFLVGFAYYRSSEFPASDIFEQIGQNNANRSLREICGGLAVLVTFISRAVAFDSGFVEGILDFVYSLLRRGTEFPEPLICIRVIADRQTELVVPKVPGLIQFCSEVLAIPDLSSSYRLATVSLLWTLTNHQLLSPEQFLPQMLDFPFSRNDRELLNCLHSLFHLASTEPALVVQFCEPIATKLRLLLRTARLPLRADTRAAGEQLLEDIERGRSLVSYDTF
jgi:hypothetical protein